MKKNKINVSRNRMVRIDRTIISSDKQEETIFTTSTKATRYYKDLIRIRVVE